MGKKRVLTGRNSIVCICNAKHPSKKLSNRLIRTIRGKKLRRRRGELGHDILGILQTGAIRGTGAKKKDQTGEGKGERRFTNRGKRRHGRKSESKGAQH